MTAAVCYHRVTQAVFTVEPAEKQPYTAVEKKASQYNYRRASIVVTVAGK